MRTRRKFSQLVAGLAIASAGGAGIGVADTTTRAVSSPSANLASDSDRAVAMKCMADKYRAANTPLCKANNARIAAISKTAQASVSNPSGVATAAPVSTTAR